MKNGNSKVFKKLVTCFCTQFLVFFHYAVCLTLPFESAFDKYKALCTRAVRFSCSTDFYGSVYDDKLHNSLLCCISGSCTSFVIELSLHSGTGQEYLLHALKPSFMFRDRKVRKKSSSDFYYVLCE
jgi:hypothetical protein